MKYTHIVWDFNGTLLNDINAGIDAVNVMLEKRGLATIKSVETYRELFCFPIIKYYAKLGFDFEKEDYYTVLAPEWVEMYLENYKRSPLTEHAVQTLQRLGAMGYQQTLLSATELQMLKGQLKGLGLEQYFGEVCGLDNIHAGSKVDTAIAWREAHPDAVALFVGDTVHDYEVACAAGADCVLYSQGHQSRSQLSGCKCPIIDHLSELIELLSSQ
ncbi:MAG: HAD family hydrolase [Clostridia bacterium]|nr:HAD family hydrolase [Clostridia bacterium]